MKTSRRFAHNGRTGAAVATTDLPPVTCIGPAPFHRPGCGFILSVYLVDAERRTRGVQAVDRWWKRFVKTCSGELEHCRESQFCKARKNGSPNIEWVYFRPDLQDVASHFHILSILLILSSDVTPTMLKRNFIINWMLCRWGVAMAVKIYYLSTIAPQRTRRTRS